MGVVAGAVADERSGAALDVVESGGRELVGEVFVLSEDARLDGVVLLHGLLPVGTALDPTALHIFTGI